MSREGEGAPDDASTAESGQPPAGTGPTSGQQQPMDSPPMSGQQSSGPQPTMPPPAQGGERTGTQMSAAVPMVDIVESTTEVVVYVDVPGFTEEQIDIHADANNLFVTADRSDDPVFDPDEGESALLTERPVRLERRISLPAHIDPEEASATQEDGVCEITVPKDEDERRHEIGFQ